MAGFLRPSLVSQKPYVRGMTGKFEEKPQRTKNGAGNGNKSHELGEAQGRNIGSVQQKRVNGKEEGKQRKIVTRRK